MPEWEALGKLFVGIGLAIAVVGVLFVLADRIPGISSLFSWVGKLPGDIFIKRDNFSLFFPLGTSIVLSLLLSLVFYFLSWIFRR
ncbi:MAG TPA: DUF2905 domain-containing protein [Nitrospira sp.]|nr:DUF2905 domain-containing protein [Nitrospira sp.]